MNKDVMEFNFNGNGAVFTRKEFGIITGLKMENTLDVPSPPYSDRIRNRYFGHIHKIKNMDVRNVFINFVNQYSWGLVSYNATLRSLQKALDLQRGELNKSSTYSLGGFPLAFQVWGYETIPLMGQKFAIKVDNSYPRICNWKAEQMYKYHDVQKMIFESDKLYVMGRLTPLNADEESVYKLNKDLLIAPLQKKRAHMDVDMEREEYAYFYQQNTFNLGGPSIENVGEPSHSSHNHDELKSYMEALNIKVDNVANDLYDFRLDSMRKIDGVANDLGNFRLESMCEFQSIHNTMREMFDYIKHDYHPTKHAIHNDHVNQDAIVHKNLETCDVVATTETQLNLTGSLLPPADFNPKRALPDELEMKLLTYMTSSDDVILDYNVCDINKQFFREMIEGEWLNDKLHIEARWTEFLKWRDSKSKKQMFQFDMDFLAYIWGNAYSPLGRNRKDCDFVLMPLNIEDRHRVLANIDLVKRQIYLYDSTLSKSTYRDQFKPLWIMLPYILKQANFFAERSNIKSTMIQFSHSYVENFPKQGSRYN
ncbi:hypothetical protein FNV43_RR21490 [Rhamnella rubrinervis]|uniref:Ubiquitin-like protease family profile domain-containing protein n=1 Tax=Rhamnella rubrinervis TaxID=2594499 RepID=A0A8K0DXZ5_9ROSA|nr:hypothetical protein FNV43_RR21490 [Rhamnella rubrinervis]